MYSLSSGPGEPDRLCSNPHPQAQAFIFRWKMLKTSLGLDWQNGETEMAWSFLRTLMLSCTAAALIGLPPAQADEQIAAGLLTCGVKGGLSFLIGSTRELHCLFRASPTDEGERYEGQIKKYGLDIGVTDNALLEWTVLAPSRGVYAGVLSGNYVGVAADASAGVGGGANILVGGSNSSISLQPLSVQGQTGLNAAVAIAEVELHPVYEGK
jgi:Protein of unknown function (DUF992)